MSSVNSHDPAPSRLSYRLQRLMLTPFVRFMLKAGIPLGAVIGAAGWWIAMPENREAIGDKYTEIRESIESRPEFEVRLMSVETASTSVAEDIREILAQDFPTSSFDLDLAWMREQIAGFDAVRTANLRIEDHVLRVHVTERVPRLLWRRPEGLELLDATGATVGPAGSRRLWPDLPVVAGEGAHAPEAVAEVLALYDAIGPLEQRLRGFERMGARRWDVVLDRGQRILLPPEKPVVALERSLAMDNAVDMFARDLVTVDLRLPRRPTLRLSERAINEYWRFKAIEVGGVNEG